MKPVNRIFVINPGSTTTKVALFEDENMVHQESLEYSSQTIESFAKFTDQYEMRKDDILGYLKKIGIAPGELTAIAARGGGFGPLKTGAYVVDENLAKACLTMPTHVSLLATIISYEMVKEYGIKAYIYDAVSAMEMVDYAKLSGLPEITRRASGHVLNPRAVSRKVAESMGKRYEDCVFVVAHLGGGCTTSLHKGGKIIDVVAGDEGTFTPERTGKLPGRFMAKLCYSGKYTLEQMNKLLYGKGGLTAYLGTNSAKDVEERIANGDQYAKTVYYAMAYQIIKDIGSLAATVAGELDGIILTGGLANSKMLMGWITEKTQHLAKVTVIPGSMEMEALAFGILRVLRGEEQAHVIEPQ